MKTYEKPIKSFSELVDHNGQKLLITINVFKEPCLKNDLHDFHTHIVITDQGKPWGMLFLVDPVADADLGQAIKDVHSNIESYKTISRESYQKHISKN
jgi:hypothetical protein